MIAVLPHAYCAIPAPTPALSSSPLPIKEELELIEKEELKKVDEVQDDLRKSLKSVGGCHASVCFAIDGASALTSDEFSSEKDFVLDVTSVIAVDQPVSLAAVQYASVRKAIKRLTKDVPAFNLAVDATTQLGGQSKTAAGLIFCNRQLWRWFSPNKIVLIGDGRGDFGRSAVRVAQRFRDRNGDLSVVAAGDADTNALLKIVGGREDRLFNVESFLDVLELQAVIEKLVANICLKKGGEIPGRRRRESKLRRIEREIELKKKRLEELRKKEEENKSM